LSQEVMPPDILTRLRALHPIRLHGGSMFLTQWFVHHEGTWSAVDEHAPAKSCKFF